MPVYEFYCEPCHTIFTFYSKSVRFGGDCPACPRCVGSLRKCVSGFNLSVHSRSRKSLDQLPFNQQRLADGMSKFRAEHERLRDEDPARAAGMLKKFSCWLGNVHLEEDTKRAAQRVLDSDDAPAQKIDALERLARDGDEPGRDDHLYEF